MATHQLDARGLLCPMPVIKAQNKIRQLLPGDQLEVMATDPGVMQDIPAWCRINKHKVLKSSEQDREYRLLIEVCGQ